MKKCISVLIITVMVLSMTACGSRDEIPTSEEINGQEVTLVDDFLIVANLAGLPSLTLPCGFVDHMPVAIHIMGRCFEEQTVLNCAYALEKSLSFSQQYCQKEIKHV